MLNTITNSLKPLQRLARFKNIVVRYAHAVLYSRHAGGILNLSVCGKSAKFNSLPFNSFNIRLVLLSNPFFTWESL